VVRVQEMDKAFKVSNDRRAAGIQDGINMEECVCLVNLC
jgi:hypothetical protein